MTDSIITLTPNTLALVPIVMALVSLVKMYLDSRWAPLFSLAFGVIGMFLIGGNSWQVSILAGLVVGLTGSGLYSGVKATFAPAPPLG